MIAYIIDNIKNEDKPLKLIVEEIKHYPPGYWDDLMKSKVKINFTFRGGF